MARHGCVPKSNALRLAMPPANIGPGSTGPWGSLLVRTYKLQLYHQMLYFVQSLCRASRHGTCPATLVGQRVVFSMSDRCLCNVADIPGLVNCCWQSFSALSAFCPSNKETRWATRIFIDDRVFLPWGPLGSVSAHLMLFRAPVGKFWRIWSFSCRSRGCMSRRQNFSSAGLTTSNMIFTAMRLFSACQLDR